MPNWCSNNATFTHEDLDRVKALAAAFQAGNAFMTFQPTPSGEWDYAWCSENWGTKWDVEAQDVTVEENTITLWFDSAWSPPIGFYDHMIEQGWEIDATYHEPGMCFAGHYDNGEDNSYEYDFSDEDWRDGIDDQDVLYLLEDEYESWKEWQDEEEDEEDESNEEE
jgi:hypothetical protein